MKYWLLLSLQLACWGQSNWYLRTIAGSDDPGDGGRAALASIQVLQGVAVDSSGNIYIADADDHRIRRIDPAGFITTIAGNGVAGFSGDGGPANKARIKTPYGLAVTPLGDIVFADLGNSRVRRITRGGIIETIAGGGTRGLPAAGQFIPPLEVKLSAPRNVLADRRGSLFISDFEGNRVLEIRSDGNMTAMPIGNVDLRNPAGMALDGDGELLVAVSGDNQIRRLRRDGRLDIVHTGVQTPTAVARTLNGDLIVTDGRGDFMWRVDFKGNALRLPIGGRDIAIDAAGNILTARGAWLRRLNPQGLIEVITSTNFQMFRGDGGPAVAARLNQPDHVAVDSNGNIYISDKLNNRIRRVRPDGTIDTVAGNGDSGFRGDGDLARNATLSNPGPIAIDAFDNVYFADRGNSRIRAFQPGGIIRTVVGTGRTSLSPDGLIGQETDVIGPSGLVFARSGELYFSEGRFPRVRKLALDGRVYTVAGTSLPGLPLEGQQALQASFSNIVAIGLDADENLYIADYAAEMIVRIERATSRIRVLARDIHYPNGLAVTASGTVFFTEVWRQCVKQISPDGQVIVIAGQVEKIGFNFDAGNATTILLDMPGGLALSPDGSLLLADRMNHRIRRIEPPPEVIISNLKAYRLVHGATFLETPLAPGLHVSLLSFDLPDSQLLEVTFDGIPAPIRFSSKEQLNFQVPERLAGRDSVQFELRAGGALLYKSTVALQGAAPGFFEQGGIVLGQNEFAQAGDVLTLYATGEGLLRVVGGRRVPFLPLAVEINGIPAEVLSAENDGVLQIKIRIPAGISLRGRVPITLRVGAFENPKSQRIAVE